MDCHFAFLTRKFKKTACINIEKQNFQEGKADIVIAEIDGSMLPIVETNIPEDGKENRYDEVLKSIRVRLPVDWDSKQKEEEGTPIEKCYKYISNRQNCLDYKGALEKDLPIGSGEIESGHRSVIQKRMKIPGAWWRVDNAENMLALRSLRANGDWQDYWDQQAA